MTDYTSARLALTDALDYFAKAISRVNGGVAGIPPDSYNHPVLFPDIQPNSLQDLKNKLINQPQDLLKDDLSKAGRYAGVIYFKTLATLLQGNTKYLLDPQATDPDKKYKPVTLYRWPPANEQQKNWGWGVAILMQVSECSLEYDITPGGDYYRFKFSHLQIALDLKSYESTQGAEGLKSVYTTPAIDMTVEIKIPQKIDTGVFPDVTFDFFGFRFTLNLNFDWLNFDWSSFNFSPLHLYLPDWLHFNLPIDLGSFFNLNLSCDWLVGLLNGDGIRFRLPNIDFSWLWPILDKLCGWLNFSFSGSSVNYFTETKYGEAKSRLPDWAAIYLDLSFLDKILGGFKPGKLFLLAGVNTADKQVRAGLITCTGNLPLLNKAFLLRATLQYDFDLGSGGLTDLQAHPGFALEILSGPAVANVAQHMSCSADKPEITWGGFALGLDRLGIQWEKDIKKYVGYVDGKFTIKKLLRSAKPGADDADLELPFKGLGFTSDGELVMKKSWIPLPDALQVRLDGIQQIALFLRAYGYEKPLDKPFWIGFSGDLRLPVLDISAGVDRLIIYSDGNVELSGVRVEIEIPDTLRLAGAVAWGGEAGLPLPAHAKIVSGFSGMLKLQLIPIQLGCQIGLKYMKVHFDDTGTDLLAWSINGEITLPATIPVCVAIGFYSFGMMVGRNYMPKPKVLGLPQNVWLEQGFDNNAENILDVVNYWSLKPDAFAAGFSVGLATTADQGFILRGKAIMVFALPGPLIMIAGKADILRPPSQPLVGIFNLLIVYDQSDPGLLISLSFLYDVKYLVTIRGMAELYFDFEDAGRWHFYLGTPDKPVAVKAFWIFDASGYLMIDARHLEVGVKVFWGYNWDAGPLAVKAYICFYGNLQIGWNPVFMVVQVGIKGELGVRIFGFGLSAGLEAKLQIKAPKPWYLYAMVEAEFSISFFFFSISFTVHFDLSWGTDEAHPDPELRQLFDEKQVVKSLTSGLRQNVDLQPGPDAQDQTVYLPMDGVLSFEFARDVEILAGANPPPLITPYFIQMKNEVSPNSSTVNSFRLQLTGFNIERETAPGTFQTIPEKVFFTWSPLEESQRRRLATRDIDQGYSQFRLNEDPDAFVRLNCPKLYQAPSPLVFRWQHPDLKKDAAFPGGLVFHCSPGFIKVDLSQASDSYQLNYAGTTARLFVDGMLPFDHGGQRLRVFKGMTLEFDQPSACILLAFMPAAGAPPDPARCFELIGESGLDVTAACRNHLYAVPGAQFFMLILNDFEDSPNYTPRIFQAQTPPPSGVCKLKVLQDGFLYQVQQAGAAFFTLFPLEALRQVYERNLERVRQQAELNYLFQKSENNLGFLWLPGKHRLLGKARWWVNDSLESGPSVLNNKEFTVIKPFDTRSVATSKGEVAVQTLESYLRRIMPEDGQRPVYRGELPGVTFRCNYINAMLQKGGRRLFLLHFDTNGQPCRFSRVEIAYFSIPSELDNEFLLVSRNAGFVPCRDIEEVYTHLEDGTPAGSEPGVRMDRRDLQGRGGAGLKARLRRAGLLRPEGAPVRVAAAAPQELLDQALRLRLERGKGKDTQASGRAKRLENLMRRGFGAKPDLSDARLAVVFAGVGETLVGVVRQVYGLVEYRYTNDDLKLDVSSLRLADCLGAAPHELNGYERGYFAPALPEGAHWDGLSANTRYTARIYCMDTDFQLGNQIPANDAVLHSFSFTTSLFEDARGPAALTRKIREAFLDAGTFDAALGETLPSYAAFPHPDDPNLQLHLGCDIYNSLDAAPATAHAADAPSHEREEAYITLWETQRKELKRERQEEGLAFDALIERLGLKLDPLQPGLLTSTWVRPDASAGTFGVLVDFPEPIDWERAGVRIDHFEAKLNDSGQIIDLLDPPQGNPEYQVNLHWLRSLDGTRLALVPEILQTRLLTLPREDVTIQPGPITPGPVLPGPQHPDDTEPGDSGPPDSPISGRRAWLGDLSVPSLSQAQDKEALYGRFGRLVVSRITGYTVTRLELSFYYLTDNYETNRPTRRGIPRLQYRSGPPAGAANGWIGVLDLKAP